MIGLVGGYTQVLTVFLQVGESVGRRDADILIGLEWDLPRDMSPVRSAGVLEQVGFDSRHEGSRSYFSYQFKVEDSDISGQPGDRLKSESLNQSFFVNAPLSVSDDNAYVSLTLRYNQRVSSWRWPLQLIKLTPASSRPTLTTVGLWDYGLFRAGSASDGIAAFLYDVGVNFIQRSDGGQFLEALKNKNILVGGYTHRSAFSSKLAVDMSVDGKPLPGTYPCPQAILNLSASGNVPKVDQLAINARASGIATIDYEPTGLTGFCDDAIIEFQNKFQISKRQIDNFRELYSSQKYDAFNSKNPNFAELYKKWAAFSGQQTSAYVQLLRDELKKINPEYRLALSSGKSFGAESISTLALGNDNPLLADKVDIAMPQLYFGYDGAGVKLLMQYTRGWRETMNSQGAKALLWPLLLVRYPGADVSNSPVRVRQQIFGALVSGAQGILLYFPGNMDASYWTVLAETTKNIASYERFYQEGHPADGIFSLRGMSDSREIKRVWPGYGVTVDATDWAFAAHEWQGQYLLTLFNLREQGDLEFEVAAAEEVDLLDVQGATSIGPLKWLVPAGNIGFVTLAKKSI